MTNYAWNALNGFITPETFDNKETSYHIAHLAIMITDEIKRTGNEKPEVLTGGLWK